MIKESSGYTLYRDRHEKQSKPGFKNPVIKLPKYTEDRKLCVSLVCTECMHQTKDLRGNEAKQSPIEQPAETPMVAGLKTVMRNSNLDDEIFKPHSTRPAATCSQT